MPKPRMDLVVGLLFLAFALVALFVWIPNDIETGILEKIRRRVVVGDALFPTFLAIAMAVLSAALVAVQLLIRGADIEDSGSLDRSNVFYLLSLAALIAVSFVLMNSAGPAVVRLLEGMNLEIGTYRELRDTVPYKYVGFILGGFLLVFCLISWIEGRVSAKAAGISLAAIVLLIAAYDLPFDDLLLPPNGDQ